jgi:hypothetical protein
MAGLVAVVLVLTAALSPTRDCTASYVSPTASFVGTVVGQDGREVTYRIEGLLSDRAAAVGGGPGDGDGRVREEEASPPHDRRPTPHVKAPLPRSL